ncbi:MAG: alpha/beta fold hydrolase [Clostridia bacterium]|nr:alpha/beta fold hydrolase [Clostridia bacterium]
MISVNKSKLRKVLKGIGVTIIIYIAVSILVTKFVYDFVFRPYTPDVTEEFSTVEIPREATCASFSYMCGENFLSSRLYTGEEPGKGLIVIAPGFRSQRTEYECLIYAFLQEGFDVFAFDATGHGESGGKSSVGFPQIIVDVDATLKFIESNDNFGHDDIFLLGYSRGGYGICCAMNDHPNITAAVSVNGMDTSMDAIMALTTSYVGGIAYINYPFLDIYEDFIFGRTVAEKSAVAEINNTEIPVLIIQSENDEQLSGGDYSIYSNKEKVTSANTEFLLYGRDGFDGHTTILYNEENQPNYDIVKIISDFYIQKMKDKDLLQ